MAEKALLGDPLILAAISESSIDYKYYEHPDFSTCELSSSWHKQNQQPGQRVKNLFLRNKNGKQHFLLMLPHSVDFDKTIFKQHSTQKCGLASDERLWQYLKTKPGAVSPLNLIHDTSQSVQVFIESTLLETTQLHFHAGSPTSSLMLKPDDLMHFLRLQGYEVQVIDWQQPKSDD